MCIILLKQFCKMLTRYKEPGLEARLASCKFAAWCMCEFTCNASPAPLPDGSLLDGHSKHRPTMRYENASKLPAKYLVKYHRIS